MHQLSRAARVAAILSVLACGLAAGTVTLVNRSTATWTIGPDPDAISASSGELGTTRTLAPDETWRPTVSKPAIDRLVLSSEDASYHCRLVVTTGLNLDDRSFSFLEATGPKVQGYLARGEDHSELVIVAPRNARVGAGAAGSVVETKAGGLPADAEDLPASDTWIFTAAWEPAAGAKAEGKAGHGTEAKAKVEAKAESKAESGADDPTKAATAAWNRAALYLKALAERVQLLATSHNAWQAGVRDQDAADRLRHLKISCVGNRGDVANWLPITQDAVATYARQAGLLPGDHADAVLHAARLKGLQSRLRTLQERFSTLETEVDASR